MLPVSMERDESPHKQTNKLTGAVKRLKKVSLHYTRLITKQSTEVVKAIISSTTLVDVGLGGIDLRSIQANINEVAQTTLKNLNV